LIGLTRAVRQLIFEAEYRGNLVAAMPIQQYNSPIFVKNLRDQ
jgi:hypothetical protein